MNKDWIRTLGEPKARKGYKIERMKDWYGNYYHKYTCKVAKRLPSQEPTDYKKLSIRLARTLVFALIAYNLMAFMVKPNDFINPIDETHRIGHRLSPVKFTDDELQAIKNKYEIKTAKAEIEVKPVATDADEIKQKILTVFGEYGDEMLVCMQSENGRLNPVAKPNWNKNGTRDFGLMRINSVHCARHGLTQGDECKEFFENMDNNLAEGRRIFDDRTKVNGRGFTAWYGKTCKQFHNLITK